MRIFFVFLYMSLTAGHAYSFDTNQRYSSSYSPAADLQYQSSVTDQRYREWQQLLDSKFDDSSEIDLIRRVNFFINRTDYVSDIEQFGVNDHWASPREFISSGQGDCEDYAIAKYFTLIEMGVPRHKLRLVYGLQSSRSVGHMVVLYDPESGGELMTLDNLSWSLTPISQRRDFKPIYSFDRTNLWFMRGWQLDSKSSKSLKAGKWQRIVDVWDLQQSELRG
ncbi:transglutaminase-like cysteine peptidase [Amphritea sp. HPY]|uniref:transglutaminase-like cysteine peptidase n=1 Tax=Amphritea sp. HPY TaxID=3421652 RepID=UPI003D7E45FE